jgi:hypothetical protein
MENDLCSILENGPLPRHLAIREEELSEIDDVSFERLSSLIRQSIKGGFEDVALIEVKSVVVGVSSLHA